MTDVTNRLMSRETAFSVVTQDTLLLLREAAATIEALRAENAKLRKALIDCESELRSVVSYIRIEGKWAYDSGVLLKMLKKADAARTALGDQDEN